MVKYGIGKDIETGDFMLLEWSTMRVLVRGLTAEKADRLKQYLEGGPEFPQSQGEPQPHAFDFEQVYASYPRKLGKQTGISWLKKNVRSEASYQELLLAAVNYKNYCQSEGLEERFIKHFSSWVRTYRDWVKVDGKTWPKGQAAPVAALMEDYEF